MQYYKTTPIGEVIVPSAQSARQAAIAAASGSQTLAVEQIVEATVQSIRMLRSLTKSTKLLKS
jgi:hypothetical protein